MAEMKIRMATVADPDTKADIDVFIAGVIGAVEATSYEMLCLYREETQCGRSWVERADGRLIGLGEIDDRPITLSPLTAVVDGQKILFWNFPGQLADYCMADSWFVKNMPATARDAEGRVNRADAMNFSNIFRPAAPVSP